jgi:hypothetical protein
MKKVVLEIDREGQVSIRAEGYQGNQCEYSPHVKKLLELLKAQGEIDKVEKLYEEKQTQTQEEVW